MSLQNFLRKHHPAAKAARRKLEAALEEYEALEGKIKEADAHASALDHHSTEVGNVKGAAAGFVRG